MSKKEKDIDEEIQRLARKSNFKMRKSEYSFDKQLSKLDIEIDNVLDDKIKVFNENKEITKDYLELEFSHDTIDRYREKLKKI